MFDQVFFSYVCAVLNSYSVHQLNTSLAFHISLLVRAFVSSHLHYFGTLID